MKVTWTLNLGLSQDFVDGRFNDSIVHDMSLSIETFMVCHATISSGTAMNLKFMIMVLVITD